MNVGDVVFFGEHSRIKLEKGHVMVRIPIRAAITAAAVVLTLANAASAVAIPAAPLAARDGLAPTLARMGGGHRGGGGYHGGHNVVGGGHNNYHGGHNVVGGGHNDYHGGHNVYRGGHNVYVGGGGWRRSYGWAPGGAIAAGAAVGFMTAATAAAVASSRAPAPGLCWYYTDASQRAGFWDNCP